MLTDSAYPALILNADGLPLSAVPLSVLCWHDAVRAKVRESHYVLAEYDREIRSPGVRLRLPAVMAVKEYVRTNRPAPLSRWNVFLAHGFRCAYCGECFATSALTFDHVVPKSKGGRSTWDNLVPACQACNGRKGDRTPDRAGMRLLRKPYHPTCQEMNALGMRRIVASDEVREEWRSYLYWNVPLEP